MHDTHQEAGVAERRNRTIVERVRALLHSSGLPKYLWAEAACHVVWLLNRTTTKAMEGMTPYEAVFGKKPNLKGLREWGEKVYVRIEGGNKLGGRVREGCWLGVDEQSKGVRIYWPDTKTITVERNTFPPTTLFSDNQSAIALTKEQQYHARTKHIDVRFHFIRWIVKEGKLRLIYCPTEEMVADALTKALPTAKVKHFANALGLVLV